MERCASRESAFVEDVLGKVDGRLHGRHKYEDAEVGQRSLYGGKATAFIRLKRISSAMNAQENFARFDTIRRDGDAI